MNRFLRTVKSERARMNAPAVVEIAERRKEIENPSRISLLYRRLKRRLGIAHRCFHSARLFSAAPCSEIILPATGHKYVEVEQELLAADKAQGKNRFEMLRDELSPFEGAVIAFIATIAANIRARKVWRSDHLEPFAEVLILLLAYESVLKRYKDSKSWVIIGDLTTSLFALASAAGAVGHRIVYWQYSYLDFKLLPLKADFAVILNEAGPALAGMGTAEPGPGRIFWRPRPEIEPIRLDRLESGPLGAFLNVHAEQEALDVLARLQRIAKVPVLVRLHPNTVSNRFRWPRNLNLEPSSEPLDDFAKRIKVAVCGNTQAQAKALALGTPVVQIQGLDPLSFDHHGYVAAGIVLGIRKPEQWSFDAIREYYSQGSYRDALRKLVGPEPKDRKPGLKDLLGTL